MIKNSTKKDGVAGTDIKKVEIEQSQQTNTNLTDSYNLRL